MSQKKMDAYKEAKKNRKANEKKAKQKLVLGWILGIIIAALLIAGSVYLVYYTSKVLPNKGSETESTLDTDAIQIPIDGAEGEPIVIPATEGADTEADAPAEAE